MTAGLDIAGSLPRLTFYRGRVALYAILKGLGVGEGDRVATQAFTCSAVPEAILAAGATPVWADVAPGSANASAAEFAKACAGGVKAIVVQHTFGIPCEMPAVLELADRLGVPVVEDCCHGVASSLRGRPVGTWGVAAFTSYEWGKPIVIGLGGSALTDDRDLYSKVETVWRGLPYPSGKQQFKVDVQYAAFRMLYRPHRYWKLKRLFRRLSASGVVEGNYSAPGVVAPGFALRMAEPLRARLRSAVAGYARLVEHQKWVVAHLEGQVHSARLAPLAVPDGAEPVYARYPLVADDKAALLVRAEQAGIEVADWYTSPIQPLGPRDWPKVGYEAGTCPNAEELARRVVSLPTNQRVDEIVLDRTIELLNGY